MSLYVRENGSAEVVPYQLDCAASTALTKRVITNQWGARQRRVWERTQRSSLELESGIKRVCFTQPVILPRCAAEVEPSLHQPQRLVGNQAMGQPFHMRYAYYRKYGAGGKGAVTSSTHNFPCGSIPQPKSVYGGIDYRPLLNARQ